MPLCQKKKEFWLKRKETNKLKAKVLSSLVKGHHRLKWVKIKWLRLVMRNKMWTMRIIISWMEWLTDSPSHTLDWNTMTSVMASDPFFYVVIWAFFREGASKSIYMCVCVLRMVSMCVQHRRLLDDFLYFNISRSPIHIHIHTYIHVCVSFCRYWIAMHKWVNKGKIRSHRIWCVYASSLLHIA